MKKWFLVTKTDIAGKSRVNWGMTIFAYLVIFTFISVITWDALTPDTQPPPTPEQEQQLHEDYYDYKHGPRG